MGTVQAVKWAVEWSPGHDSHSPRCQTYERPSAGACVGQRFSPAPIALLAHLPLVGPRTLAALDPEELWEATPWPVEPHPTVRGPSPHSPWAGITKG